LVLSWELLVFASPFIPTRVLPSLFLQLLWLEQSRRRRSDGSAAHLLLVNPSQAMVSSMSIASRPESIVLSKRSIVPGGTTRSSGQIIRSRLLIRVPTITAIRLLFCGDGMVREQTTQYAVADADVQSTNFSVPGPNPRNARVFSDDDEHLCMCYLYDISKRLQCSALSTCEHCIGTKTITCTISFLCEPYIHSYCTPYRSYRNVKQSIVGTSSAITNLIQSEGRCDSKPSILWRLVKRIKNIFIQHIGKKWLLCISRRLVGKIALVRFQNSTRVSGSKNV